VIPVARVKAPKGFRAKARVPGEAWLKAHPSAKRPKDTWSPFLPDLDKAFGSRCGYAAMLDPTGGTVDHYRSFKNHPHLAYDWRNYRFASHAMNASKSTADEKVLDPFEVKDGWFEILLPSLQMQVSATVPAKVEAKARFTLKRLKLGEGEKVLRWRRQWYELYQQGKVSLDGLRVVAPLIADAVVRQSTATAKASKPRVAKKSRAASARKKAR
jgi:hypothetical protein